MVGFPLFAVAVKTPHAFVHVAKGMLRYPVDDERRTLVSHEHEGLVRTWHHTVVVAVVDDASCRYEDRIDIDVGVLTPVVALYASIFYRHRQRRWRRLARLLAASAPGAVTT